MKTLRNFCCVLLLALLGLVLFAASGLLPRPSRLWVGGTEVTAGGSAPTSAGSAVYDPDTRTLTLTGAVIEGQFHGAAIYAEGELILRLWGDSRIIGQSAGVTALGDLTVSGQGSLVLEGEGSGAQVRGCLTVFDSVELSLRGREPLRWGKLHVSPMDMVLREEGTLWVLPPYSVLMTDGALDAAGRPLQGEPYYETATARRGEPVPVPPEPEKEGYWFGGWYADPELTRPFDFSQIHMESTVLYARWIQIVALRFDSWGGSEVPDGLYAWGETPAPPEEPVREGWRFLGWYGDERLRTEYDWTLPLEGETWAYARWEKLADYTLYGIDAARYQGEVDWPAVKDGGVSFVFLRIGYRGYGSEGILSEDANFETNYREAVAAGLDVGVYLFSQAVSTQEAVEEARYVLELLDGRELGLPVVMDFELASDASGGLLGRLYDAGLSGEEYAEICLAFCREIEAKGYTAAVYAGTAMFRDELGEALAREGFGAWLAHWTVQTRYNGPFDYWQYSGSGHVSGIGPEVDLDVRYVLRPPQVTGLRILPGPEGQTLQWDRVPGVQGYLVYRADGDGGFAELARLSGAGSTFFTDPERREDSRYMVCAYLRVEGKDLKGEVSEIVSPETPYP